MSDTESVVEVRPDASVVGFPLIAVVDNASPPLSPESLSLAKCLATESFSLAEFTCPISDTSIHDEILKLSDYMLIGGASEADPTSEVARHSASGILNDNNGDVRTLTDSSNFISCCDTKNGEPVSYIHSDTKTSSKNCAEKQGKSIEEAGTLLDLEEFTGIICLNACIDPEIVREEITKGCVSETWQEVKCSNTSSFSFPSTVLLPSISRANELVHPNDMCYLASKSELHAQQMSSQLEVSESVLDNSVDRENSVSDFLEQHKLQSDKPSTPRVTSQSENIELVGPSAGGNIFAPEISSDAVSFEPCKKISSSKKRMVSYYTSGSANGSQSLPRHDVSPSPYVRESPIISTNRPSLPIRRLQEQLRRDFDNEAIKGRRKIKEIQSILWQNESHKGPVSFLQVQADNDLSHTLAPVARQAKPYRQWHRVSKCVAADSKYIISKIPPLPPMQTTHRLKPVAIDKMKLLSPVNSKVDSDRKMSSYFSDVGQDASNPNNIGDGSCLDIDMKYVTSSMTMDVSSPQNSRSYCGSKGGAYEDHEIGMLRDNIAYVQEELQLKNEHIERTDLLTIAVEEDACSPVDIAVEGDSCSPVDIAVEGNSCSPVDIAVEGNSYCPVDIAVEDDSCSSVDIAVEGDSCSPVDIAVGENSCSAVDIAVEENSYCPVDIAVEGDSCSPVDIAVEGDSCSPVDIVGGENPCSPVDTRDVDYTSKESEIRGSPEDCERITSTAHKLEEIVTAPNDTKSKMLWKPPLDASPLLPNHDRGYFQSSEQLRDLNGMASPVYLNETTTRDLACTFDSITSVSRVTGPPSPDIEELMRCGCKAFRVSTPPRGPTLRTATRSRNRVMSPLNKSGMNNSFSGPIVPPLTSYGFMHHARSDSKPNSRPGSRNSSRHEIHGRHNSRISRAASRRAVETQTLTRSKDSNIQPSTYKKEHNIESSSWSTTFSDMDSDKQCAPVVPLKKMTTKVSRPHVTNRLLQKVSRVHPVQLKKKYVAVQATLDYEGTLPGQLSFRKGQIIKQRSFQEAPSDGISYGYYRVGKFRKKRKGLFPSSYVTNKIANERESAGRPDQKEDMSKILAGFIVSSV